MFFRCARHESNLKRKLTSWYHASNCILQRRVVMGCIILSFSRVSYEFPKAERALLALLQMLQNKKDWMYTKAPQGMTRTNNHINLTLEPYFECILSALSAMFEYDSTPWHFSDALVGQRCNAAHRSLGFLQTLRRIIRSPLLPSTRKVGWWWRLWEKNKQKP